MVLSARGNIRDAAIFWGAAERLGSELGPANWQDEPTESARPAAVLADDEGLAVGRSMPTAEAVELAGRLAMDRG
jgi:hypothetical protein